ncbi:hypothetical protein Ae201684P_005919 [Aphanomyces euteiches]|nr:hypothetical protein Ae201684P_005919 [Aphanomyces euteiches]
MSRSALSRHEFQQAMANRMNAPAYYAAVSVPTASAGVYSEEEARQIKENELPLHGNLTTYNINKLLFDNIMNSDYFRKLYELKTYHEVVDEIYYRVDHAEPWAAGTSRIPSTCFCLLLKFCTMRLAVKQMQGLLKHVDSPYIRCVGFLYLRYTCDPEKLWEWYAPYLDDEEEFNASANDKILTTMGAWVRTLLEDVNYFNTILPRIPKKIQDGIKIKLLLHEQRKKREKENQDIVDLLVKGTKVRALYADEENAPAMYDAVIDEVDPTDQTYWVSFPEYGNTEKISLGDIEFDRPKKKSPDRRRHRRSPSPDRSSRRRSRSRDRKKESSLAEDLMAQVREKERRKAEAVGKDYAARPASYKGAMSLKQDRFTTRKRSRSPVKRDVEFVELEKPKETTAPRMSWEAEERRRKLVEVYGDAGAKSKPKTSD